MKSKYLKFDLMKPIGGGNERFIATMRYEYSPVFKFDFKAFKEWIESRRPSLKGKPFDVYTDDKAVTVLYFNQDINQIMRYKRLTSTRNYSKAKTL